MPLRRFGTFEGVFTPCLVSILGVIMYLRLGWVVGQVGFVSTVVIIVLANLVTISTALSMSSIVTNIRIGAGGAYSIITKSLGAEAGGAIGLPLYISQAISVAFYITGFSESWAFVFPAHSPLVVSMIAWAILLGISYFSAKLAFRIQFFILGAIVLSIVSIFLGKPLSDESVIWTQPLKVSTFWAAFAIFFPAVTGILAGASMSGELKDPRKSIPLGTLAAIVVSFVTYILLAFWFARQVPADVLRTDNTIAIDMGRWSWMVVIGIMGATISSGLSMFVGAPRILQALGKHGLLPFSRVFGKVNQRGEPARAIGMTALIVFVTLILGNLDQIAALLTMFFLITYGMINLVVLIEQSMGIPSFRPAFRVPRPVVLVGTFGCFGIMFLINAPFSLVAMAVIVVTYVLLIKGETRIYSPDIRSGFLVYVAEEMAKVARRLPYYPKIWKPNLLWFVGGLSDLERLRPLIETIIAPTGRLSVIVCRDDGEFLEKPDSGEEAPAWDRALDPLRQRNFFVESSRIDMDYDDPQILSIAQLMRGLFFPPNTVFYSLKPNPQDDDHTIRLLQGMSAQGYGIVVYSDSGQLRPAEPSGQINLWIRQQSPNVNLSVLMALQLYQNREGRINLVQVVSGEEEKKEAEEYLSKISGLMRLPQDTENIVLTGRFRDVIKDAPAADIHIFGMPEHPDTALVRSVARQLGVPVLFLRDSKHESALA